MLLNLIVNSGDLYNISAEGDSLTADERPRYIGGGQGPFTGFLHPWLWHLQQELLNDKRFMGFNNYAVSGDIVDNINGMLTTNEINDTLTGYTPKAVNLLFLLCGLNNIQIGQNAATAYAAVKSLHQVYHSKGYKTVAFTLTASRTDFYTLSQQEDFWDEIVAFNSLMRSGYSSDIGASALIDLQLDPALSGFDAPLNLMYFQADKIHFNQQGYIRVKDMARSALDLLLGLDIDTVDYNGIPAVLSSEVVDATTVSITFSESIDATTLGWAIEKNGSPLTINSIVTNNNSTIEFDTATISSGDTITISYSDGNTESTVGVPIHEFSDYEALNELVPVGIIDIPFPDNLGGSTADTYFVSPNSWQTTSTDGGFSHDRISNMKIPAGQNGRIYLDVATINSGLGLKYTNTRGGILAGLDLCIYFDQFADFIVVDPSTGIIPIDTPAPSGRIYSIYREYSVGVFAQYSDDGGTTWTTNHTFDITGLDQYKNNDVWPAFDVVGATTNILVNPRGEGLI